jgi:hypothetical protein
MMGPKNGMPPAWAAYGSAKKEIANANAKSMRGGMLVV